jgi:hypothetical protein
MRFDAGAVRFADAGAGAKTRPVELLARTGKPITHWYWGAVVHDLSGVRLPSEATRVPIDYCHEDDEIMGFLDKFTAKPEGLVVSGSLVPFKADDRVAEVTAKADAGVPYQASIYFDADNSVIEEVPAGMSVPVNGEAFIGPGVVFRQWMLRGVAICPYGYDAGTQARFSDTKDGNVAVQFTKGSAMAETQAPPVNGQKFIDTFGADGAMWFAQGKTFEQAQGLHMDKLVATVKAQGEQIAKFTADLKTASDSAAKFEADAKTTAGKLATVEGELAKYKAAHGELSERAPVSGNPDGGVAKPGKLGHKSGFTDAIRILGRSQSAN